MLAENVDGGGRVILGIGGPGAVEDEVGGCEDKGDVLVAAEGGEIDGRVQVDGQGVVGKLLAEVEIGDGGGMDDGCGLHVGHHRFGLAVVAQIDTPAVDLAEEIFGATAAGAVVGPDRMPALLRGAQKMGTEEAGRAGDQ